jgi:CheY-like chemotaxis protein
MKSAAPLLMVVDDDEDIREVLKLFLEVEGYRVVTAVDGRDALQQLQTREQPSLILLDLMMPGMDGEQFMNVIRRGAFAEIPVVIMSGHREASNKVIELNANCCLMKPVEYDDLMAVVHRFAPNGQAVVETSEKRDRKG